ncbi:TIGR03086 family metal-binding protein [Actinophytocola sp.]|uniref:TIGR03086 family metal-binding protein n=1 Tax=Actinophytocola sp. TaxID=1872138 RepID=UPI00389B28BF
MELYRQAQDEFDKVLAAVSSGWDTSSTCAGWTVRDVAGHAIWGQHQLRAWATGGPNPSPAGAPGAPHPAVLTAEDPLATWRAARTAADAVLTPQTLTRTTTIPGMGEVPVVAVVELLTCDLTTHAWDIGHPLGQTVRLPDPLVAASHAWARAHLVRAPGFFGPELTPPTDADAQTRMLAFLGRAA